MGQSILGLSLGCARCHDHKYDPVSMADYYALYGILASSQFSFPGGEELQRPRNLVPLAVPEELARRETQRKEELARLDKELTRVLAENQDTAPLRKKRQQLADQPVCDMAYGVTEGKPGNARIQKRGEPDKLGPEAPGVSSRSSAAIRWPNRKPAAAAGSWPSG